MTQPRRHEDLEPVAVPSWLSSLASLASAIKTADLSRLSVPEGTWRSSAVLILFGDGDLGPDVLLIERAHDMRSHAGQPAFPGGALDGTDQGPIAAALREAVEETGLDPAGVAPFAVLPELWVPPSSYVVTPVLAWWRWPSPVRAVNAAEVASVHRVSLAELTDPANRFRVRHRSGFVGAAFGVRDLIVWGFTGGLLDRLIYLGGWERPWDSSRIEELPEPVPTPVPEATPGEEAGH